MSTIEQYGRTSFTIYCVNAGSCFSFRKGHSHCAFVWMVLKALDDVASRTMSKVTIQKTRGCSGKGVLVADTIAKGETLHLFSMGLSSVHWVKKTNVTQDWFFSSLQLTASSFPSYLNSNYLLT